MLKRTISGACYVILLVAFFLLRQFVATELFHILTYFFILIGTLELARALKEKVYKWAYIASMVYALIYVPIYALGEYLLNGTGFLTAIILCSAMLTATTIYALIKDAECKKIFWTALLFVYPSLLLLTMLLANDMANYGFIVLLLSFVVSPLSDTFAYLVGCTLKGPKLCPKLSPKKTWSGAIGGTIGGILASLAIYFIFPSITQSINFFSPVLFFIMVGLVASIINIFGDLFESFIKRKVGIKDMGKIMPGHGGVLDRIDGTSFVIVFVYLMFLLV